VVVSTWLSLVFVPGVSTRMDDVGLVTAGMFGGLVDPAAEREVLSDISAPALPPSAPGLQPVLPRVPSPSLVAASVAADSSQILIRTDVDNTVRWKPGERLEQLFEQRCDQLPANQVAVIAE